MYTTDLTPPHAQPYHFIFDLALYFHLAFTYFTTVHEVAVHTSKEKFLRIWWSVASGRMAGMQRQLHRPMRIRTFYTEISDWNARTSHAMFYVDNAGCAGFLACKCNCWNPQTKYYYVKWFRAKQCMATFASDMVWWLCAVLFYCEHCSGAELQLRVPNHVTQQQH